MQVWLNGDLVDQPMIPATDRGFALGDGLFETMRLAGGQVRHWPRHLARLHHGAGILALPIPVDDHALAQAVADLAAANQMGDAVLRLTLTRGSGPRGLLPPEHPTPTLMIAMAPVPPPLGPARVTVSHVTRRNEFSPLCAIKTLNYLDMILARQDAQSRGFDDAIVLNTAGKVAESTVSSLFAVLNGQLVTPPARDGVLLGVVRSLVIEHLGAKEQSLSPDDLTQADELILTNALGARPVIELDGRILPVGAYAASIQALVDRP